eukprot:GHVU01159846.1.p2 GENE.GHVU01159846.1~~GHVU01159846.1.p2  ORF type:complete len:107 (+),score=10.07 GHVU01159846.1:101-421(+)
MHLYIFIEENELNKYSSAPPLGGDEGPLDRQRGRMTRMHECRQACVNASVDGWTDGIGSVSGRNDNERGGEQRRIEAHSLPLTHFHAGASGLSVIEVILILTFMAS